ncbi:MAG: hypothetical protein K6A90_13845 [Lachnospiraceae bacterium]|nr:hypothetical protein [Lachnospiraceae bacterium]
MLTLKAPIELKNRSNYIQADDSFYNRISANYSLIGSEINNTDLLHAVTSPPEIFISEGDITTVSGSTFINNKNEEKLSIFNNLLNRILVNAEMPLTYQDRVYISDVLYKIGIRNDTLFMNEVKKIREENESTNNLITEFLSGGEEVRDLALRQYVSNFIKNIERNESPAGERVSETTLSREIMDRLHTGAIYQILSNFNTSLSNSYVSRNEFLLSEQTAAAREILAERFVERYTGERSELIYRNENIYEDEFLTEEHEENTVNNEITAAVLLDMVRNLYSTGYERLYSDNRKWMEFRDILHNSSDNTLMRLNYLTSDAVSNVVFETNIDTAEISFPEEEPAEEREVTGEAEDQNFIRYLQEINERNVRNMEKYKHLLSVIERTRSSGGRRDGESRTRSAARAVLRDNINPLDLVRREEESTEDTEARVFKEIERLFPDEHTHINRILNEYTNNVNNINSTLINNNIANLINDIESVNLENRERELILRESEGLTREETEELRELLTRERYLEEISSREVPEHVRTEQIHRTNAEELKNVIRNIEETTEERDRIRERREEVTEEIRKAREREAAAGKRRDAVNTEHPGVEIVHKRNETLTREEIEETLDEFKKSNERNIRENTRVEESNRVTENVIMTGEENRREMTTRQIEDITALIDQGVRGRMDSISEEVMQRLERRLNNEKARRGI